MIDSRPAAGGRTSSLASLVKSCAWLALAVLVIWPAFAWFGHTRAEWMGVLASAIAAGICWLSGALALVTSYFANQTGNGVQGVLGGMLFRMGIPLAGGLLLDRQVPALAESGIFPMVLGFYLIVLVIETLLSLQFVSAGPNKAAS